MHFIARNGSLETDDYKLEQIDSPAGFKRPLVSLTFDDSTPNLYDYVIPELDKLGYKSTSTWSRARRAPATTTTSSTSGTTSRSRTCIQRGHEIGSHTESPSEPCQARAHDGVSRARTRRTLPIFKANPPRACGDTEMDAEVQERKLARPVRRRPTCGCAPRRSARRTRTSPTPRWPRSWVNLKRKLEGHIGYGVPTIAYPFGSYDSTVVAAEKALGVQGRPLGRRGLQLQDRPQPVQDQGSEHPAGRLHGTRTTGVVTKTGGTEDAPTCGSNPPDDERRYRPPSSSRTGWRRPGRTTTG